MSNFPGNLLKWHWPFMKCSWRNIPHYLFTSILLTSSLIGAITYLYKTSRRSSRRALRLRSNESRQCVPTMFNLGNTCFANSLLQGLASSKAFFKWLQMIGTKVVNGRHKLVFLDALKQVIQELNDTTKEACSASDVIDALLARRWSIPPNTEQDLYELFNVFVTTWDEELAELRISRESPLQKIVEIGQGNDTLLSSPVTAEEPAANVANITRRNVGDSKFLEDNKIDVKISPNSASMGPSFDSSVGNSLSFEHVKNTVAEEKLLKPPCMGLLAVQLRCCKEDCLYKKIREEKFCVLSLSLPKSPTPLLTFSNLLEDYFAAEYIQGASCDRCLERKSGPSGGVMKKHGFCQLPSLLIFRIERVGFSSNGNIFKRSERFLLHEFIDVREYCFFSEQKKSQHSFFRVLGGSDLNAVSTIAETGQQCQQATQVSLTGNGMDFSDYDNMLKYKYQIRAVSVHIGQAHSGHFITYRRGIGVQNRSNWYKTSDMEVSPVSFDEVASSEAYMLFYDRVLSVLN